MFIDLYNFPLILTCLHNENIHFIGSGKVLHRLRGHDSEVLSLAWCPVPYNTLRKQICFRYILSKTKPVEWC